MAWHRTSDGSFLDHSGKVLFFSKDRFLPWPLLLCLRRTAWVKSVQRRACYSEWVLRKFNLFNRAITLPNGGTVKYGRFKVPCRQDCNSLMGRQIEERISKVLNAGPEAVQKHIAEGNGLEFFVWLGLIFLKVHLKDREFRIHHDLREPDDRIGDSDEHGATLRAKEWPLQTVGGPAALSIDIVTQRPARRDRGDTGG
jgi:hypothetical protein